MSDVSIGAPLEVKGAVLVPLVVTRKDCRAGEHGLWLAGQRCAAGVLVKEPGGTLRAFAVDGSERDAQVLMAAFPELARVLAAVER